MNSQDLNRIDIARITSFRTVLAEFRALDGRLRRHGLDHYVTFNTAYTIVTNEIMNAAADNYFDDPEFIERFTVCFAHYYFEAINDTLSDASTLPSAWAKMNRTAHLKSVPVFIPLLMGANAHINHDLPLALVKFMDDQKTDNMLKDVRKVDKLLMKSGRQIIDTFDEPIALFDIIKRRFQFLYYLPIMYMILFWRVVAWRNYRIIRRHGVEKQNHAVRSVKIADRFLRLGSMLATAEN